MRGVFALDEPTGPRWELALEVLGRGDAVALGHITLRRTGARSVEAAVASAWLPENLTEDRALAELSEARTRIERLRASDNRFSNFLGDSTLAFVLVDDYDTGSIVLCQETTTGLEWLGPHAS
jgi:hypothetical protein